MTMTEMIRHGSAAFDAVPPMTRQVLTVLAAFWDTLERAVQRRAAAELGRLAEWTAHDEARSAQLREAAAACREAARAPRPSSTTPGSHR
jgi:erythromycin esterase-like protein